LKTSILRPFLAFVAFCLLAFPAVAHQSDFGYSEVVVDGSEVTYLIEVPGHYLPVPGLDPLGPPVEPDEVRPHMPAVTEVLRERVAVSSGHDAPEPYAVELVDAGRDTGLIALALHYRFDAPVHELAVKHDLFDPQEPSHKNLAKLHLAGKTSEYVFTPSRTVFRYDGRGILPQAWSFLLLGIEHIFTGYDHLAFVLAMILVGRSLKDVAKIVTGFTVAHSLTLILAALGIVSMPDKVVESVIALSIAVVAAENLFLKQHDKRWIFAFAFGLVHGFGFSGVLRELGLPTEGLVSSLLSFNLGVEVGQLAVVAVTFPLVIALRRTSWHVPVVRGASVAVLVMGLVWFGERVLG
jgi:HupE / UreJ protein.